MLKLKLKREGCVGVRYFHVNIDSSNNPSNVIADIEGIFPFGCAYFIEPIDLTIKRYILKSRNLLQ